MIAADGGLVAGGDARNSSRVLLVITNRPVKPTDLPEGDVEVKTLESGSASVLRACHVKFSKI
jgi:hypothetical protein